MSETILYVVIALLAVTLLVFGVKIYFLRKTLKELDEGLTDKLDTDTNTPVSLSGLDLYSRKLATDLNRQIERLRKEQHAYESKNADIKNAVTNIAHDIRTPLTAINGYLELFEKVELSEEETRWFSIIRERTDNLKELAEDLFSYSVACTDAESLKLEKLCINEELENALAGFYGAFKSEGIEPEIEITEQPVYRMLDRKAFGRIVNNLLSNALKYSGGDLKVSLSDAGIISISNHATKLENTDVARLFDRFYTIQTAKGSTGLGLSIARMLTEKLGGEIKASLEHQDLIIRVFF